MMGNHASQRLLIFCPALVVSSQLYVVFKNVSRTAIVVFQLFLKMVMGNSSDWGSMIKFLIRVALGA